MNGPVSPQSQGGFTLAETLVALFILSILAVAGGQMLLRATASGEQLREREAVVRELDVAQAFIRGDLEAAARPHRGLETAASPAFGRGPPSRWRLPAAQWWESRCWGLPPRTRCPGC